MLSTLEKSTHKNQITTRLNMDVKKKLDLLATQTGQSKTQIVADAMESYMLRYPAGDSSIRIAKR